MSVEVFDGPAIKIGYEYKLQVEADMALFPLGCVLVAHVRRKVSDTAFLTSLTTANAGLTRISDMIVEITIPASVTSQMQAGTVFMDMVRTDLAPDLHLNFALELPVILPVTRGL